MDNAIGQTAWLPNQTKRQLSPFHGSLIVQRLRLGKLHLHKDGGGHAFCLRIVE